MHVVWWDYILWNCREERESSRICVRTTEHMGHESEKWVSREREGCRKDSGTGEMVQ